MTISAPAMLVSMWRNTTNAKINIINIDIIHSNLIFSVAILLASKALVFYSHDMMPSFSYTLRSYSLLRSGLGLHEGRHNPYILLYIRHIPRIRSKGQDRDISFLSSFIYH